MKSTYTKKNLRLLYIALAVIGFIVSGLLAVALLKINNPASAAYANNFNASRIIDDVVFYNSNAIDANQIQSFLNAKVTNCNTNGANKAAEWGRPDLTRAQFAATQGWHGPPYTCLKDFKQDTPQMGAASSLCSAINAGKNQSAAQIINNVAKACNINPQVLLVLLEKEQSLVTDIWPLNGQYRSATGFACPDTAPCDPAYNGFFYQVYHAARQFNVYKAYPNSYNYIAGRTNRIYWHPDTARCGSSQVYIENQATAALYIYTPYRPNQAALNNLYGTGDSCSSYGNRNFWRLFTDWFGSTLRDTVRPVVATRYEKLGGVNGVLGMVLNNGYCNAQKTVCWQEFKGGYLMWSSKTGAWESKGGIREYWGELGYQTGIMGYPIGPENWDGKGWWQAYENGYIIGTTKTGFWESSGVLRDRWAQTGYQNGFMGYPRNAIETTIDKKTSWQEYENGYLYWTSAFGAWESKGAIRTQWAKMGYALGRAGAPTGPEKYDAATKRWSQNYQNGTIYYSVAKGGWFEAK